MLNQSHSPTRAGSVSHLTQRVLFTSSKSTTWW